MRRLRGLGAARVFLVAAIAASLAFYLVNALHFGELPLRIEENEWPPMAAAILEHGKPVIPFEETHRLRFLPSTEQDRSDLIGAWHPPLYLYTAAAAMLVLGDDASYSLRIVGVAGWLLTCLLVLLTARRLEPERWFQVGGASVVILLVHPYAIQGSTFLDIDTQIYAPIVMAFLYLLVRWVDQDDGLRARQLALLVLSLTLVLWTKLTTAIALVGVTSVYWIWARGWRRGLREMAITAGGAGAVFLITYWGWTALTGIPFSYTFDVTFVQKSNRLFGTSALLDQSIDWHVAWLMPGLLLLAAVFGAGFLVNLARTRRPRPVDVLWLFAIGVLANYVLLSPTDGTYQGKYVFTALAPLVLSVMWMLLRREMPRALWPYLAAAAVGVVSLVVLPDLLSDRAYGIASGTWQRDVLLASAGLLLLAWLLVRTGWRGFGAGVAVVLALMLVGQSLDSYEADSSPMYPVTDTEDYRAALRAIKQITGERAIAFVPKDLGFGLEGPIVEGEDAFARGDAAAAALLERNRRVVVVARDSFGPPTGPLTQEVIDRCFAPARTIGTVQIYGSRGTCGAS